jgi:hypothetical protein
LVCDVDDLPLGNLESRHFAVIKIHVLNHIASLGLDIRLKSVENENVSVCDGTH